MRVPTLAAGRLRQLLGRVKVPGAPPAPGYSVFTEAEIRVLDAIAEALFPLEGAIPVTPTQAGTARRVDRLLAATGPVDRNGFRALLQVLEHEVGLGRRRPGPPLSEAPLDERIRRLEVWDQCESYPLRTLYQGVRTLLVMAYMADPEVQRHLGMPAPSSTSPVGEVGP